MFWNLEIQEMQINITFLILFITVLTGKNHKPSQKFYT